MTTKKLSIETLRDVFKAVVPEENEFEYRQMSICIAFLAFSVNHEFSFYVENKATICYLDKSASEILSTQTLTEKLKQVVRKN